jgi:hypothetical protein
VPFVLPFKYDVLKRKYKTKSLLEIFGQNHRFTIPVVNLLSFFWKIVYRCALKAALQKPMFCSSSQDEKLLDTFPFCSHFNALEQTLSIA